MANLTNSGCSYAPLLRTNCEGIVHKILDDMRKNRFSVGEAMNKQENPLPPTAVLYRWWFPEDSPVWKVITDYHQKHIKDDIVFAEFFKHIEQCTIKGKTYYALYFGKSNKGSRRYNQHTKGTVGNSTIRHTVYGLLFPNKQYDPDKEQKISDIVHQCYCEWVAIDGAEGANWIGCLESICIALGNYPLNVDGNPAIGKAWRKVLLNARKISKK